MLTRNTKKPALRFANQSIAFLLAFLIASSPLFPSLSPTSPLVADIKHLSRTLSAVLSPTRLAHLSTSEPGPESLTLPTWNDVQQEAQSLVHEYTKGEQAKLAGAPTAAAATFYWVGSTGGNTNDAANWASSNPASCTGGGAGVPSTNDVATFDPDCDNSATINANWTLQKIDMQSGYSGTVTQASGVTITLDPGSSGDAFAIAGGTFAGGDAAIDINDGNFNQSGGAFTNSSGDMTVEQGFTVSGGTFTNTGNTVTFDDNGNTDDTTVTCSSTLDGSFILTKNDAGDFINGSGCTISLGASPTSTLGISGTTATYTNNGTLTIDSGTWAITNGVANGNSQTFTNNGTITHSGSGWEFNDFNFTNSATGTVTYSGTALTIDRNFTQSGTFDLSGKTVTHDGSTNDAATITCSGSLGGTLVISQVQLTAATLAIASGCSVALGASPTSNFGSAAAALTNNGTITIASGTWTVNSPNGGSALVNNGTITHSGSGWDLNDFSLTNNSGATITYAGTAITIERNFTQSGTFNLSGITITFDDTSSVDDTTITCSGSLGGTVVITKDTDGDFINSSGCNISLGASPTTTIDPSATNDFDNNGTVTITSGTWTITGTSGGDINNDGTITHSGNGWDINTANLINNSGGAITYSGTAITIEGSLNQSGTFNLSGVTITFDDDSSLDDSTVTCSGSLGGTVVITKNSDGDFINVSGCSINLGASPTTIIDVSAATDFDNNGTVTVASGTWTVDGTGGGVMNNDGIITHSGSGWDFNDANLTNNSGGAITYSGTSITIDRDFTQSGTFDLSGKTITFDDDGSASDDSTLTCGSASLGSVVVNKPTSSASFTVGSSTSCTLTGSFTRTDGLFNAPGAAVNLTIQGDLSISSSDAFGGTNLTVIMGGGNNQTITHNAGSVGTPFKVDKSGGTASLATNFTTTNGGANVACDVVEGTFDLNGKTFACDSTFTIEDGGILELFGSETTTTPVLNSGSTVKFTGDGDSASDTYTLTTLATTYHHLTVNSTDGATDTFNVGATLDINGNFTNTAGTVTASGNAMTVGGNWSNSGTFTHGSNTVTLDGADQEIFGSTTFNNLTKIVSAARTLTFPASTTQTIVGTTTLQGASGNLLSLRSSSTNTQWRFNPQGTRAISFVDVKDSNNTNSTTIATAGNNMTDSGNNTNWAFNPNAPSSLAGTAASSSSIAWTWTDNATDETGFRLYNADTNALVATISGSNTTGYTESGLSSYTTYRRYLKAFNDSGESPASNTAEVRTLSSPPNTFSLISPASNAILSDTTPTFAFYKAQDEDDGIDFMTLTVDSTSYTIPGSSAQASDPGSHTHEGSNFTAQYFNENDGNSLNDQVYVTIHSALDDGEHGWRVVATDIQGNDTSSSTRGFTIDSTAPTFSNLANVTTSDTSPTLTFTATDDVGLDKAIVTLEKATTLLGVIVSYQALETTTVDLTGKTDTFTYTPKAALEEGSLYRIKLTLTDTAQNQVANTMLLNVLSAEEAARQQAAEALDNLDADTSPVEDIIDTIRNLLPDSPLVLDDLETHAALRREKQAEIFAELFDSVTEKLLAWLTSGSRLVQEWAIAFLDWAGSTQDKLAQVIEDLFGNTKGLAILGLQFAQNQSSRWWQRTVFLAGTGTQTTLALFDTAATGIHDAYVNVLNSPALIALNQFGEATIGFRVDTAALQERASNRSRLISTAITTVAETTQDQLTQLQQDTQGKVASLLEAGSLKLQAGFTAGRDTRVRMGLRNRQYISSQVEQLYAPVAGTARRVTLATRHWYEIVFKTDDPTHITNVRITSLTPTSATVEWDTNHLTRTAKINYGTDPSQPYTKDVISHELSTHHSLTLTDLNPDTTYYFEVMNQNGDYVYDAYYTLTTPEAGDVTYPLAPQDVIIKQPEDSQDTSINVYTDPNPDAEVLATVKAGERYRALLIQDGWVSILMPNAKEGWLLSSQVEFVEQEQPSAQAE